MTARRAMRRRTPSAARRCRPPREEIERSLEVADEYCQARGERLTPIRRKVLGLLLATGRATKAYALLDQMRDMHPGSAPPTVYRALAFLLSANLIHRIETINAFAVCHDLTHCQHGILIVCQDWRQGRGNCTSLGCARP